MKLPNLQANTNKTTSSKSAELSQTTERSRTHIPETGQDYATRSAGARGLTGPKMSEPYVL